MANRRRFGRALFPRGSYVSVMTVRSVPIEGKEAYDHEVVVFGVSGDGVIFNASELAVECMNEAGIESRLGDEGGVLARGDSAEVVKRLAKALYEDEGDLRVYYVRR